MMNLTRQLNLVCKTLKEMRNFHGVPIITAKTQSEEQKMTDALSDEMTSEEIENYINNYACANFHLDLYEFAGSYNTPKYIDYSFNRDELDADFREFLAEYIEESAIPREIDLEGGDTEFIFKDSEK